MPIIALSISLSDVFCFIFSPHLLIYLLLFVRFLRYVYVVVYRGVLLHRFRSLADTCT